ncbi:MAG: hypothetical protein CL678_01460 [Bdellovibrionaceae bacterium]|nr:hypothetical protein [Pseudobdellovibrionaceae bacterium]|tara:strand:- start:4410 stop:6497 length:2088 start_codon:yes stop_codon:yes gene_type:complete
MLEKLHTWFITRRFRVSHFFWIIICAFIAIALVSGWYILNYIGVTQPKIISNHTIQTVDELVKDSGSHLEELAAAMLEEKARDVAFQATLLARGRSGAELAKDDHFQNTIIQKFLKTGYTGVLECGPKMIVVAHPKKALRGTSNLVFAKKFPKFWKVFKPALNCQESRGRYKWSVTDGQLRDKYAVIKRIPDTDLMLVASIFLDEFTESKDDMRAKGDRKREQLLDNLENKTNHLVQKAEALFFLVILVGVAISLILSGKLTKHLLEIRLFAKGLASGDYRQGSLKSTKIVEFDEIQQDQEKTKLALIENQEMLRKQASAVAHSNLANQVAHDLKPVMANLETAITFLKRKTDTKNLSIVQVLEKSCAEVMLLVDAIRSPSDNHIGLTERFDLTALIDELIERCKSEANSKGKKITFRRDSAFDSLFMVGSIQNIRRVFDNLLKNAIEAIDSCGTIEVRIERKGTFNRIKIIDSGKGIPKGREEDIFRDGVTIGKESGSGIGLHVSRMMVSQHGGSLVLDKSDEHGAIFSVTLPAILDGLPNAKKHTIEVEHGKQILVVDDKVPVLTKIFTMAAARGISGSYHKSFENFLEKVNWYSLQQTCGHILLDNMVADSSFDAVSMAETCIRRLGRKVPISIITSDHKEERLETFAREYRIPIYPKSFLEDFSFSIKREAEWKTKVISSQVDSEVPTALS